MVKKSRKGYDYTVVELFEAQVNKTPNHVAISHNGIEYTYQILNEKSNQYACWLKKQKVEEGAFVGLLLEPGADFIVCMLAIIKAGAVYLPLDALAPKRRLAEIVDDAKPKIVLTNEEYSHYLNEHEDKIRLIKNLHLESASYPRTNFKHHISPTSPIYMMYTSGSTGRPKGVIIPHRAVVNLVKVDNSADIQEKEIIAQFSNLSFDASIFEIWSALLNGAHIIVVPPHIRTDHTKLKIFIENNHIQHLFLPTSYFHQLIKSAPTTLNNIKVLVFGGEQINKTLLSDFKFYRKKNKLPIILINGYGPTEATTFTCSQMINENSVLKNDELASIGKAINNVTTYVLDENKSLVTEGELYISGVNLAIGYHNCNLQNNEKFINNPFCKTDPFQRLYKTGDKVRVLPSGNLLCLGRFDDQVKIGGFRIYLNEIENQLMQYPSISLAAVNVEIGGGFHKMLTAYIVFSSAETVAHADDIRQFLSQSLPPYMLPAKYVMVDELPLTLVGKVDKSKLDKIPHTDLSFHIDTSSSSTIEETIKTIWAHLLNRSSVDPNKNLFELGANSLLITEACAKINKELQSELQIADVLSYPTIYKLSRYLEGDINAPIVRRIIETSSVDIAIIGMACRFPKANSLQEFWENLCQGEDCLDRFDGEQLSNAGDRTSFREKNHVPVKGILSDIDQFDASFFGFNPVDARITDPQLRLFLECAWEALEHAAIAPNKLDSTIISVFAGMTDSTYLQENLLKNNWFNKEHDRFQQRIASSTSMLSTQISYRLNLRGRSINVNTACSTGLMTVDQACQDLILGQSDIGLAGASSIVVPQVAGYKFQQGSIESPDGVCRPFSDNANGTVFSNGVGVVILKRLSDAIADQDTIYAIIRGRGVNNDGSDKLGFTAPSTSGQMSCIRDALDQAQLSADDISYLEAHGTATALGDVIEIGALTSVYREQTEKKQFCVLGSVKGNIGHTDVTAGIAGLIKTALCLYHQKIPATVHFEKPNPNLFLNESPFFINTQLMDWSITSAKRYAGVSAFGVGGTNVHLILSEHIYEPISNVPHQEQLMLLSAKTEKALEQNTQNLIQYFSSQSKELSLDDLANVAYTLQMGRADFQWRRIGVGKTTSELIKSFTQKPMRLCDEHVHQSLVFMFPGQGMQYHGMAIELMKEVPRFALLVEKGAHLATSYLNCDLLAMIRNPRNTTLRQTQYAQPALFIVEYALAQILMDYGIKPDALIGHSVGEYVAACLASVFSFEDAIALVCERGLLMASAPAGAMLAIECTVDEFAAYQIKTNVELALHNAPHHCVASGSSEEIDRLEQYLLSIEKSCQRLKVSHAFHSRSMETIQQSFKGILSNISLSAPTIPIVSNVTGDWLSAQDATNPDYWYRHLRNTVKLCEGFEVLIADEHSFFIEVGPGHSLSAFLKEVVRTNKKTIHVTHTLSNHNRQTTDLHQLLTVLGNLWQAGVSINWATFYENEKRRRVPLPTYSFQRQRYWIEPDDIIQHQNNTGMLYKPVWSHQPAYLDYVSLDLDNLSKHSWIIFKDKTGWSEQFISLLQKHAIQPIVIELGMEYSAKKSTDFTINPAKKEHYVNVFKKIKKSLHEPIVLHLCSCNGLNKSLLSSDEIDAQLEIGFFSVLYLAQSYIECVGDHVPLMCLVITIGTQQVVGTESISPVNASLIGPCRVITEEHAALKFRLIDINPDELSSCHENVLNSLLNTSMHEEWNTHHPMMVYRNGFRWDVSYSSLKPQQIRHRFQDNGVYLLTGGLGGIALSLCECIARTISNPTFILLSRSLMLLESEWDHVLQDPSHALYKKIKYLREIQALGATLFFHQVDVAQFESVLSTVNHYKLIHGVIHCAGIAGSGLVQLKSKQTAHDVLRPKIHGTYNLAKALQGFSLDFVVLMSSIVTLVGEQGQVDYSAANACLDAFAVSGLFSSKFVVSINWNTWRDIGMTVETARPDDVDFFDRGNDIAPQQGQQLFLQAMESSCPNIAISNYDLDLYATMLAQRNKISESSSSKIARQDLNVTDQYLSPQNSTQKQLASLWQDSLGIEGVGINDDFFSLGGHSLKALKLVEKINKTFGSTLTIQHLYKAPSIAQLSKIIDSGADCTPSDILVPLKIEETNSHPIFFCHPASGLIYCFNTLVSQWQAPVSIYGLQDPSISAGDMLYDSISSIADAYLSAIKTIQPQGPYFLVGYSFGGSIVYEIANRLQQHNEQIGLLALIEGWAIFSKKQFDEHHFKQMFHSTHHDLSSHLVDLAWARMQLLLAHTPTKMKQDMLLFKATELFDDYKSIDHPLNGWSNFNSGEIVCHSVNANHETILNDKSSHDILNIVYKYIYS